MLFKTITFHSIGAPLETTRGRLSVICGVKGGGKTYHWAVDVQAAHVVHFTAALYSSLVWSGTRS